MGDPTFSGFVFHPLMLTPAKKHPERWETSQPWGFSMFWHQKITQQNLAFLLWTRIQKFTGVHPLIQSFLQACTIDFRLLSSSPTWINRIFEFKSFHPQKRKQVACSHERITPRGSPLTSIAPPPSLQKGPGQWRPSTNPRFKLK